MFRFFGSINGFANGPRQARFCHFPGYGGENRRSCESIFLRHLPSHACIMARVESQERSIQTIPGKNRGVRYVHTTAPLRTQISLFP